MRFSVIIPAHNEEDSIGRTLDSLVQQKLRPTQLVVIDDNSTDNTLREIEPFSMAYSWIHVVHKSSSDAHLPGAKIINAFYEGFARLNEPYDIICKFDADLIFPENYLEKLAFHFKQNPRLGMAAGFCYIEKAGTWVLEDLTRKDHIRGALKAYRKKCFQDIGQLKKSMGWDTVDELLAQYYGWELLTDDSLHIKHLKPTGVSYDKTAKFLQGEAMYKMRYGFWITLISAFKLAFKKGRMRLFIDYISGYLKARREQQEFLVSRDEGKFIRRLRWQGMFQKITSP